MGKLRTNPIQVLVTILVSVLMTGTFLWAGDFVFSLDIGSDSELSDPVSTDDNGFDPGDLYRTSLTPVVDVTDGTDGAANDDEILREPDRDPNPDAETVPLVTVPIGTGAPPGAPTCYRDYFDLDGYDAINLEFLEVAGALSPPYLFSDIAAVLGKGRALNCIHEAEFLAISFDDDSARGWATGRPARVPADCPSPLGQTHGQTDAMDEILGLRMQVRATFPFLPDLVFGIASEEQVHADLVPNPDSDEADDDDVDALDTEVGAEFCDIFLYSADKEASDDLRPGCIYQHDHVTPIIRPTAHLGIPPKTDIDAFEMVWLPISNADNALALLFSVDDDDPRTHRVDESGGLHPGALYGSFFGGSHFEVVRPVITGRLYATNGPYLLELDRATGAATLLGEPDGSLFGMASNSTGHLFIGTANGLLKVDPSSPTDIISMVKWSRGIDITGMSFNNNDELYAIENIGHMPKASDALVKIDTATGKITDIGMTGNPYLEGLAFDPSSQLWAIDSYNNVLCKLEVSTGAIIKSMAIDTGPYNSEGWSLDCDAAGRLFMANEHLVEIGGYSSAVSPKTKLTLDLVGKIGYDAVHGLAFQKVPLDDIDAVTASPVDLYDEDLKQPVYLE